MIGRSVSHYRIISKIGEGGMGEVYRATDTKLNRDVALKILPQIFAQDEQRMGRFEREAQVLASLNHPNIASIHGLEEANGTKALAMELVEGEDLSQRIARGPIPLDEALPLALQVAEALESAHEKGIIHRDLKPANIKLTPEGKVKVLDFGLAKALDDEREKENIANSPTLSMAATQAGIILGTAAYMSPEQAKGKRVDRRTDIWSFGTVLYEMLTGQKAFKGDDLSEVMASVIMKQVDLDTLSSLAPKPIRKLITRCLKRDIRMRLQHIGDARIVIEEYLSGPNENLVDEVIPIVSAQPLWKRLFPWAVAGVLTTVLVIILFTMSTPVPEPESQVMKRVAVVLPSPQQMTFTDRHLVAFSPLDTHIAYTASDLLYLRALDQLEAKPISGSDRARIPFFSPDGQWLGFYADGLLKKVSINGGAPLTICETSYPNAISWTDNDRIVFGRNREGIFQVSAHGGKKELLFSPKSNELVHGPQVLPGGQWILFTIGASNSWNDAQIVVQSLKNNQRKVLINGGTDARYLPTKHLVYVRGGILFAVPFDPETLEINGNSVPVMEGIQQSNSITGVAHFSFSNLGSLVFVPSAGASEKKLVWVDRDGKEEPVKAIPRPYGQPRLSPDGRLVALGIDGDIWLHDLFRETSTRVTFDNGSRPAWFPDGKGIVFTHQSGLFTVAADGSREAEMIAEGEVYHSNVISPDGKTLLLHAHYPQGADLLTLKLDGKSEPQPLMATDFNEDGPVFSPDGKWIAYTSDETGQSEIYIRPFPGPGGRTKVSTDGGDQVVWKTKDEIFYKLDDRMMAVPIQTEPKLNVGRPQELFSGPYHYGDMGPFAPYDVTPDGKRFLMIKSGGQAGESRQELILVLNWFEELKRLCPLD